ncbi:MAG TPA: MarR family EPS-associated transcriptional regulator [Ferrovaceae bacterium]|nr:MarR family EPS-associated transcriptional regulator [Ferrovaceae bacterium]
MSSPELEFEIIRLIEASPHLSQREIARELTVSLGAVNYCMQALMDKGWMKIHHFSASPNKWKYVYVLTPKGIRERVKLTKSFLVRKLEEYQRLEQEIALLQRELDGK